MTHIVCLCVHMQLAECLLEKEVLNYKDIVEILGPIPYEKKIHQHHELQDMWFGNPAHIPTWHTTLL